MSFPMASEGSSIGSGVASLPRIGCRIPAPPQQSARLDFRPALNAGTDTQKRLKQRAAELIGYHPTPAGQIRFAA